MRRSSCRRFVVASLMMAALAMGAVVAPSRAFPAAAAGESTASGWGVRPEEGQIDRLYRAVFGRAPDDAGREYWLVQRTGGLPLEQVADSFVESAEYQLRFGVADNGAFIDRLYRNVLGRRADGPGRDYWLAVLAQGAARALIVIQFSESPEFVALTGTGVPDLPEFAVSEHPVTATSLGASWRPGCPVDPSELVELQLSHLGFDGEVITGRLVVASAVSADVIDFFATMYRSRLPVEMMRPASEFDGDDDAMMAVNNTSGFNCRPVTGGSGWSRHAFGRAIDINPLYNPYVTGTTVLPPAGADWVDRSHYHPAMLRDGDPLVAAAHSAGWRWGGDWTSLKDYQHIDVAVG